VDAANPVLEKLVLESPLATNVDEDGVNPLTVLAYRLYLTVQLGGGVTPVHAKLMMLGEDATAVSPVGAAAGKRVQALAVPRISIPMIKG
jgi:hypothetical protein